MGSDGRGADASVAVMGHSLTGVVNFHLDYVRYQIITCA